MKKLVVVVAILMFFAVGAVVNAEDQVMRGKAGKYSVEATFERVPPVKGINELTIVVKDASGNNVTNVTVGVEYFMTQKTSPNQKSTEMPYMRSKSAAVLKDLVYKASLDFSMSGQWHIPVKITDNGKTSKADFFVVVK